MTDNKITQKLSAYPTWLKISAPAAILALILAIVTGCAIASKESEQKIYEKEMARQMKTSEWEPFECHGFSAEFPCYLPCRDKSRSNGVFVSFYNQQECGIDYLYYHIEYDEGLQLPEAKEWAQDIITKSIQDIEGKKIKFFSEKKSKTKYTADFSYDLPEKDKKGRKGYLFYNASGNKVDFLFVSGTNALIRKVDRKHLIDSIQIVTEQD